MKRSVVGQYLRLGARVEGVESAHKHGKVHLVVLNLFTHSLSPIETSSSQLFRLWVCEMQGGEGEEGAKEQGTGQRGEKYKDRERQGFGK